MGDKIEIFVNRDDIFLLKNDCELFILQKIIDIDTHIEKWSWLPIK